VIYEQFSPQREAPLYEVDWHKEMEELHRAALDTIGQFFLAGAYVWTFGALIAHHPRYVLSSVAVPLGVALLGTLLIVIRRPLLLRRFVLVAGSLAVASLAMLSTHSLVAPYLYLVAITAVAIVGEAAMSFAVAALASIAVAAFVGMLPDIWPREVLIGAVALFWTEAVTAWLVSRNLHTALIWALNSYERSWRMTRELQVQRGKLGRTMKDLADASLLLKGTTYDLALAREEAERARQLKSQFAANISHELRTPLHLIVGFSQMLCMSPDNYEGVVWTPELRGDIREVYDSASHLLRLIDDVLDLSQIEREHLPLSKEHLSLAALIRETVETGAALLRDRGLYLDVELQEDLPAIYADPTRIRQVLLNLLNNASRFTYDGGMTVRAVARDGEIEVTVEDTGIGIPADQLEEVFLEFHQVDGSPRRTHDGTGLGLAICRQFVQLHGGRIWAESEVGKGSRFHFTLPLPETTTVPLQRPQLPRGWRHPAGKLQATWRLVTLSDPPEFARLLGRYLPDCDLLQAPTLAQAAELARGSQADAIVLPEGGISAEGEVELAQQQAEQLLPVITCSWPLEQRLAMAQGFSHCLMKPFAAEQLLQVLQQAAPAARRILVVDDDAGVGRLVERLLKAARPEARVYCAYDGEEAISMLEERPDVVLLDLLLPKVDGLGVLRELRSREGGGDVPVAAITAFGFEQDVALLGQGLITVRRGKHFSAGEITRWLETVLQVLPARYLTPGGHEPGRAPAPPD